MARCPSLTDRLLCLVDYWNTWLEQVRTAGKRVVVWGGGSKGVSFLNAVQSRGTVEYVVDINPHKQNQYVGGTGQKIIPPRFLKDYKPHYVIAMNKNYKEEINLIN